MPFDFEQIRGVLLAGAALLSAALTALWLAMIIWTFRDMRTRTSDVFAQILASLAVAVLTVPGLLVYLILRPQETLAEQYERSLEEEALLREIEDKQICPGCRHHVKDNWRVCPYCHTRLKKDCLNCGELLDLPWALCPYCGNSQVGEAPRVQRAGATTDTEYGITYEVDDL